MSHLPYRLDADDPAAPPIGLIVLQADETLEPEMRQYFRDHPSPVYVSRIASAPEVTRDDLAAMAPGLSQAADLLPKARAFAAVGYGCTSASAVIGSQKVEALVRQSCATAHVTDPLRAATACAAHLGVSRFALLSPYIAEVSAPLRAAFARAGISTEVFGSFGEAQEAKVARISQGSIIEAATALGSDPNVDAVFISCTNLKTRTAIPEIRERLGKPVLSSNQSLAWHTQRLALAQ